MGTGAGSDERVLVLATGADARRTTELLDDAGLAARACSDARELVGELRAGASAVVLAQEALGPGELELLADALGSQPEWSDPPLFLLALRDPDPGPLVERLWLDARSRVTVLERPHRAGTLLASVRAGLQSRARQYQVRDEIARRREAERSLRERGERLRAMADELPLVVWLHDAEGRQQFVNRTFCEYFGMEREQMREDRWRHLVHPDDDSSYADAFSAAVRDRSDFHAEVRVRRADGRWRWLESWGRPRFAPDGEYLGHVGTSADVTERRQVEASLRVKTALLEEQDRKKDLFIATLGHELRNPLAALDLELRLLEDGADDVGRIHERMGAHVQQLTSLVNDLLEVSRITRGKLGLRKTRTDLVAVVRSAANVAANDIHDRKQELVLSLPDHLYLEGDATRLEQIVANLLSNASTYTPGQGRIEVRAAREEGEAVVSVRDTGRGLRPDQLESVFEPFVQDDPLQGGLGIGLALTKGLVELHGGSVRAASEGPGRGSIFTVRLPVGDGRPAPTRRPGHFVRRLPGPARILVVDDNRDFAQSLAILLRRMGAETRCAHTGADGLEQARTWSPEAVLVDLGLPDTSGFEVARGIRGRERGAEILLVAVTGYGDRGSEEEAWKAGFDEWLVKPVDPDKLHAALGRRFEREDPPPASSRSARRWSGAP